MPYFLMTEIFHAKSGVDGERAVIRGFIKAEKMEDIERDLRLSQSRYGRYYVGHYSHLHFQEIAQLFPAYTPEDKAK